MVRQLPHMASWAHQFVGEVLSEGDLAVDLTAGLGKDTLFLYRVVGPGGCVAAFDIQKQALLETSRLLREAGAEVCEVSDGGPVSEGMRGVRLVNDNHALLQRYIARQPKAIMANLGYLPGGDPEIRTHQDSTLAAVEGALDILAPGGRLVIVVYVGHPGGRDEGCLVAERLARLCSRTWYVLRVEVENRREAPYLLVAEKRQRQTPVAEQS